MGEEAARVWKDHPFDGAFKCQSPGCPNWFVRSSNRHRYCKVETCTYRRGTPAEREPAAPGATGELLRRLQDTDGGEVGATLLRARREAVVVALRAGDREASVGALVDEAEACVRYADRIARGDVPQRRPGDELTSAAAQQGRPPVGLALAAITSHQRTIQLSEHRVKLMWALMAARDELASAEHGVEQMAGSPQEEDAQTVCEQRREAYQRAERALEAVQAAWQERVSSLGDLANAAGRPSAAAAA